MTICTYIRLVNKLFRQSVDLIFAANCYGSVIYELYLNFINGHDRPDPGPVPELVHVPDHGHQLVHPALGGGQPQGVQGGGHLALLTADVELREVTEKLVQIRLILL